MSPRDARNDAVVHDLEEPLGELVRALQRRQIYRLISDLEHIYGELDDAGQGPQGGGEGIAA